MLCFTSLSAAEIRDYLARQAEHPLTYPEVGATRHDEFPAGYDCKRHRVRLGRGADVFAAACDALRNWVMLPPALVEVWMPGTPLEPGRVVAMQFRLFGLRLWSACRIVYTVDEERGGVRRFGFAYGTLPDHIASGEGRYLVEWDQTTDDVWYEIASFAQARFLPARWFPWMMRREQRRLHHASARAMQQAVRDETTLRAELLK